MCVCVCVCVRVCVQVADCVCLMGLDHLKAVPVDVHVRRLAQRDYGVGGAGSLTHTVYRTVGEPLYSLVGQSYSSKGRGQGIRGTKFLPWPLPLHMAHILSLLLGDKFREVFGATAGWAQAVSWHVSEYTSLIALSLSRSLCPSLTRSPSLSLPFFLPV